MLIRADELNGSSDGMAERGLYGMRKSIVSQRAIVLDERFIELQAAQVSSANSGVCCRQTDGKREDANSNFRRCKPDRSRQAIGALYFNLWITMGE